MGTILSQVVGKLLGSGPLCDSECSNIQCCSSTQRVVDSRWPYPERPRQISDSTASDKSTGRSFFRRKKRMSTTIYIDSRKRTAGDDSSFEFDIGETLHLQTGAKLSVFKFRVADAFLSTDRGQYLFWIDEALQTLNWAVLPVGAYTGSRLAANHLLGPSFIDGALQIFRFVVMNPYSELFLRCSTLANAADIKGPLGQDIICKMIIDKGVGFIMSGRTDEGHFVKLHGPITLRTLRFKLTDVDGNVVYTRGTSVSFAIFLDYDNLYVNMFNLEKWLTMRNPPWLLWLQSLRSLQQSLNRPPCPRGRRSPRSPRSPRLQSEEADLQA